MIAFDALPSRTPFAPHRTSKRLDPMFDSLWVVGSSASWSGVHRARSLRDAGLAVIPKDLDLDPSGAWGRFDVGTDWDARLDAVAVADAWRNVTGEQMAALTGRARLAGVSRVTSDLFSMGVFEYGRPASPFGAGRDSARSRLWRLGKPAAPARRLIGEMTCAEQLSVTGGTPLAQAHLYDRHNILAAELALRVAEFCPVSTVLGEKFSSLSRMMPPEVAGSRQADATIVRRDGLRIAVELTAAAGGRDLDAKVAQWAKTLSVLPLSLTGVVVVFVIVGAPGESIQSNLLAARKSIASAVRTYAGGLRNPVRDRIFVAGWTDWFPDRGMASDAFMPLRAARATGVFAPRGASDSGGASVWAPADLLDPVQVPFAADDPISMLEVVSGASMLRQSPHWLRVGRRLDIASDVLRGAGFASGVPYLRGPTPAGKPRLLEPGEPRGGERFAAKRPRRLQL